MKCCERFCVYLGSRGGSGKTLHGKKFKSLQDRRRPSPACGISNDTLSHLVIEAAVCVGIAFVAGMTMQAPIHSVGIPCRHQCLHQFVCFVGIQCSSCQSWLG